MSAPRVTARKSSDREPQSPHSTMLLNGIEGVVGTGRQVPAWRWTAIGKALVDVNKAAQKSRYKALTSVFRLNYRCHLISSDENSPTAAARWCPNVAWSHDAAAGRTRTRKSPPGGPSTRSNRSVMRTRSRRRMRLRTTAPPTARLIAYATLGSQPWELRWSPSNALNLTSRGPRRTVRPSRRRARKSSRNRSRRIKPTVGIGPSGAGSSQWPGLPWYACACGSRACGPACGRLAGMCASLSDSWSHCGRHQEGERPGAVDWVPDRDPNKPDTETTLIWTDTYSQ